VTGVILAAGSGTRLSGSDVVRPKCLAPFDGTPLIELQMRALRSCGVDDIVVVTGFESARVRHACGSGIRFVENPRFAETNSLFSLWLTRSLLATGFVVLNCDVLFHPAMLVDLITARHENALLVSYPQAGDPAMGDEEMKVCVRRGRVVDIAKDLPLGRTDGENVGIVKFSAAGAARLVSILTRIVESGQMRDWAPRAFGEFAREEALYAIGTRGLPWTEIDTPEDYHHASHDVFPAIRRTVGDTAPALTRGA
jgi:L-glutamine-phosphate cytidylyltransferase